MAKRVVILGAGESGAGAAVLAKVKGFDVFVSDKSPIKENYRLLLDEYNIEWESGEHTLDKILNADEVIKSPGIPDTVPVMKAVIEKGINVVSEIEFAGRYTNAKMICITGSNGKTTTTLLTYHILKSAGLNVGLAGNVGKSLALQVATENFDYYVIELSSFQLDNMYDFKANIAVLLNITPDHLDRYGYEMQNYVDAKFRITQNQTEGDAFIFWNDDPIITEQLSKYKLKSKLYPFAEQHSKGVVAYKEGDKIIIGDKNGEFTLDEDDLALEGRHNLFNSMAASISAKVLEIKKEELRAALSGFKGVEHRLEKAGRVRGVEFINDSKATNVNSCWYALESMKTPVVLIIGGKDKGNDYTEIEQLVKDKVKGLVCLGVDNSKLHNFFDYMGKEMADALSMKEAVEKAFSMAQPGDTVLLSPCCASFDLFNSYEDRGEQFKKCVKEI
ncbi:MAG: UDP-N-acetylmuramoyl-L-alanine--D-glutamate ligase [Bacteroidales bacterium]|nr:UDP-N-acetylmuramoyl-L-alanine--D-glutamate ligase [Bacteroidales bacterium]MBQ7819352.1 UDP-N-acetylmuramoyl-L-alanine--D-glutamate ligase [Bacteroidales bacterium]